MHHGRVASIFAFIRWRLTPACSGLAALATDARRWAAAESVVFGASALVSTFHALRDCAS